MALHPVPKRSRCFIHACFLLACLIGASGCSSMTPQQCLQADWYLEGEQAAVAGLPVTQFMTHHRSCSLHGINPNRWDFVLGWEAAQRSKSS